MMFPTQHIKIYVATRPVDFRKGMDGLAAIVQSEFDLDPLSGALFVFRSKRSDRMKVVMWDGTGLVMTYKRIENRGFVWPNIRDGIMSLSRTQFEALFEGVDWRNVSIRKMYAPKPLAQKAPLETSAI